MVSIVIVNYKLKNELFSCIDSILNKKQDIEYEIIVVDNSEKNEIENTIKKKYKKVKYFKSSKNLGYGNGNNFGVEKAKGEYIFILNPDTKIASGKISSLVNFIKRNKKIGAVAPQLLDSNNEPYDEQGASELTPFKAVFVLSFINKLFKNNKIYKKYWGIPWNKKKSKKVDIVPGTAFVIKKSLFQEVGGFDSKFFLYFEEFDLCRRLIKKGYKNYILPDLKLHHIWGASTRKNNSSKKYFLESRFYYFKKNFGILKAIFVEFFLRINKEMILFATIAFFGVILRVYNLEARIAFIGDYAWFFVSAKNLMTQGIIPYVGITSSHVWLHQGAFWTYILAFILPFVNFNPYYVSYFTIALDVLTLTLIYLFCKKFFNLKTALFASVFYATSPFLIQFSQNPYHVSPIPFLTIILIYTVNKWVKGNIKLFPAIILLLTLLYNFQISILPLVFCVMAIFSFGLFKKKEWVLKLKNKKVILWSILAFFIPMIPMLIHDLGHGFPQTIKVAAWMVYRLAVLFGYPPINPEFTGETWNSVFKFILEYNSLILFSSSQILALILLFFGIVFLLYKAHKNKFNVIQENILIIFLIIPIASYVLTKTNSGAYLPMIFSQLAILVGYLFGNLNKKITIIGVIIFLFIVSTNIYKSINVQIPKGLNDYVKASKEIVKITNNEPYNIIILGSGGEFKNSSANFQYLTWLFGHEVSDSDKNLKIYVNLKPHGIIIEKKQLK